MYALRHGGQRPPHAPQIVRLSPARSGRGSTTAPQDWLYMGVYSSASGGCGLPGASTPWSAEHVG
jgi:hypothetical protein